MVTMQVIDKNASNWQHMADLGWYFAPKVAACLGIHRSTAWQWLASGKIPGAVRWGRYWCVKADDLIEFMNQNRRMT